MVDAREKYIASQTPRVRRTHPARSAQALNTSGAGIVHRQMMDLQRQPNLNKADTARLKDLRRDWNRNRKYTDAGMKISGASSPLDAQKYFADTTRDFRDTNRDAYASMYPLTNMAMEYPQKGGILGMMAKEIFGKVSDFGKSIINKEGIAGAADTDEGEMEDYAAQTFGMGAPIDRHLGSTPVIEGPGKSTVLPNIHTGEIYYDRGEGLDFEDDPNQPYVAPDNYVEKDFGDFYIDADTLAPERGLPFDDSVRERAIMERYPESFIGPPIDPSWRPDMYDVTGPRLIDRGLFPYPNYNDEVTLAPPPFYGGRGEMPGMDSPYYNDMMEGIERGVREKELQDALEADQGRSLITIPPDFDPDRKEFTNTEDYYEWIRDMRKYGYR